MNKIIIKNTAEILNQLTEILLDDAATLPSYQRDVYMYVNADGVAELSVFENVGGNSWLNDDHYTICTLPEHHETVWDNFDFIIDLAGEPTGMTEAELIEATVHYFDDMIDADEVDLHDVLTMCRHTDDIAERVCEWYAAWSRDENEEYVPAMAAEYMRKYNETEEYAHNQAYEFMNRNFNDIDDLDDPVFLFDEEVI